MSNYPKTKPEEMTNFGTLLTENNIKSSQRWGPSSVSHIEGALSCGSFKGMSKSLRKNITYSFQYIQYIQLQLDELNLHSVIYTQLCKSYVIISMGIIEGIFYHLLKSAGKYKKEEWEELTTVKTNEFNDNGIIKKHIVSTYQKLTTPKEGKMDFENMIQKIRSCNLIKLSQEAYPYIKDLKEIRNKVHLHISKDDNDTDYHKLSHVEYYLARHVLYKVLTNEVFDPEKQGGVFNCIELSKEKNSEIAIILHKRRENKK